MTGSSEKPLLSASTIRRVTGQDGLPRISPPNHRLLPDSSRPMAISTKYAGLRNTKAMSTLASSHSCARPVARVAGGMSGSTGAVLRVAAASISRTPAGLCSPSAASSV